MHVHNADRCDLPNFNTMGKYLADGYSHSFTVAGDGTHRTNSLSNEFKLKPGQGSVLSKALVIHAVSDLEKFDPKSDSEAVVACGVIARQQAIR
jgi:Cu/Zn superoxide dismutase